MSGTPTGENLNFLENKITEMVEEAEARERVFFIGLNGGLIKQS